MKAHMKLIAVDKNNKKRTPSEVVGITRDGWVVTKDGAFGDLGEDCNIEIEFPISIKQFRKDYGLSQQELGWIFGKSRQTIVTYEKDNHDISLKEYLILQKLITNKGLYEILSKKNI